MKKTLLLLIAITTVSCGLFDYDERLINGYHYINYETPYISKSSGGSSITKSPVEDYLIRKHYIVATSVNRETKDKAYWIIDTETHDAFDFKRYSVFLDACRKIAVDCKRLK